jgi:DNA polymerase-4
MSALCRDCYAPVSLDELRAQRCARCGGERLLQHGELDELSIAHIDCDAFYAAIEKRDNPELADKPVIIGGGKRGVVSTACYIARRYGVHSAQPMFKARQLCPQAIIIRPNMAKYTEVGRAIRTRMLELTPLVEPLSLDEAFLDLTGTERLHHTRPAETLARFQAAIESEFGLTVSVGLSYCKFLAKAGSDLNKPRGFSVIGREEAVDFLSPRPVSYIWGIGAAFTAKLQRDGLRTIGDLRIRDHQELVARYGAIGARLPALANGIDERKVDPAGERKSISSETTLETDIADVRMLTTILWAQAERVSERAKAADLAGRTIVLKLKTADFRTKTRHRKLYEPTQLADTIFKAARDMLLPLVDGTPYRLVGVGLADLTPGAGADVGDLADPDAKDRREAERAIDKVRAKFGRAAIGKGRGL